MVIFFVMVLGLAQLFWLGHCKTGESSREFKSWDSDADAVEQVPTWTHSECSAPFYTFQESLAA